MLPSMFSTPNLSQIVYILDSVSRVELTHLGYTNMGRVGSTLIDNLT